MPFDGADFPERRDPPRCLPSDSDAATVIIVTIAFSLLVAPISLSALVDVICYVWG